MHALPTHDALRQILPSVIFELADRFVRAGHELSLVGGPVRDLYLGRVSPDLDFTTSARPEETLKIVSGWADNTWDVGREFGTIAFKKGEARVRGKRDCDSIAGTIELPMGTLEFAGTRD